MKTPERPAIGQAILEFLRKEGLGRRRQLGEGTRFLEHLGMDSIDLVRLLAHLEIRYRVEFDEAEVIPALEDVAALADLTFQLTQQVQQQEV